jgi:aminoglycoside phosphotransferase (APT) family kinase protein
MSRRSLRWSGVHGFSDDDATRELLRSRPPDDALEWAGSVVGGTVVSASPIRGGTSSAVHLLRFAPRSGPEKKVVLRRYVRPESMVEEPDIAEREARTLEHVEGIPVPTPRLLGVDPSGSEAGDPAILMTLLDGRVDWWPDNLGRWVSQLAELLPPIHDAPLPPRTSADLFSPYAQCSYEPPVWATTPAVWERAFEVFHGPRPATGQVFIQRDFHPGNVLCKNGEVSGVVDWQAACIGPPSIDVGHCRMNLFSYGLKVADDFQKAWERESGLSYDPWAEVVSIIGMLDVIRAADDSDQSPVEDALARAVAALGVGA